MNPLFFASVSDPGPPTQPPLPPITIDPNDAFVWISGGQSNEKGNNGQVGSIDAKYQGIQNGNVWYGGFNSAGQWGKMQSGQTNQNLSSGLPVDANWSISFLYEMDAYIASLNGGVPGQAYLIQWPQGGSRLRITSSANDWNSLSNDLIPGTDAGQREYLFQLMNGCCGNGFNEFPSGKNIRIMGFTWRQGEADSNYIGGIDDPDWNPSSYNPDESTVLGEVKDQYKSDFSNMLQDVIDYLQSIIYESNPIITNEMRVLISRMNPNAANVINRPYYSAIELAFTELASGYLVANSDAVACDVMNSDYNFIAGDGVHDLHQAQIQMGIDRFNYFKEYIL